MRTITTDELKTILENHRHWWDEDCEGWEGMRADLRNADLSCADLSGANLRNADLRNADLSGANLSGANLSGADLSGADLSGANLSCADLSGANLSGADLRNADLSSADLRNADLSCADLSGADLSGADLSCADLSGANLRNANLSCAKGITMACPSDGAFTAWKKLNNGAIAKLLIPENAKRCSATGRKCRCDKAVVIAIYDKDGNAIESMSSTWMSDFIYKVGEYIVPDSFDDDRWNECSHGIHFFITRTEAEEYIG